MRERILVTKEQIATQCIYGNEIYDEMRLGEASLISLAGLFSFAPTYS
jgi:hypothetical protein